MYLYVLRLVVGFYVGWNECQVEGGSPYNNVYFISLTFLSLPFGFGHGNLTSNFYPSLHPSRVSFTFTFIPFHEIPKNTVHSTYVCLTTNS